MPGQPASTSAKTARRRRRERQARLDLIRQAGARVFASQGYEQATMAQVAEEAELGKASLYYYFKTKQELFCSIVEQLASDLAEGMDTVVSPGASELQVVENLCRFALGYFRQNREKLAVVLPLIAGGPVRLRALVGPRLARKVMAAHSPVFRVLGSSPAGGPQTSSLMQLIASYLIGLATKVLHGGGEDLLAELELFLTVLGRARAGSKEGR